MYQGGASQGRSQQTLGQTLQNTRKKTSCSVASRRCSPKPPLSVRGVGERVRRRQIETLLPGSGRGLLRAPASQPISRKQRLLHCLYSFGQFFFFFLLVFVHSCAAVAPPAACLQRQADGTQISSTRQLIEKQMECFLLVMVKDCSIQNISNDNLARDTSQCGTARARNHGV